MPSSELPSVSKKAGAPKWQIIRRLIPHQIRLREIRREQLLLRDVPWVDFRHISGRYIPVISLSCELVGIRISLGDFRR